MYIIQIKREEANEIASWQYEEPYELYSFSYSKETIEGLLGGTYYSYRNEEGELIGYFCFGEEAQVPGGRDANLYGGEGVIDIGLGMKPQLTGKGLGEQFLHTGIDFAERKFQPKQLRLSVASFNKRAIRLYENAGFIVKTFFMSRGKEFLLMIRE
ncbi:acetyltransferase [Bacillus manliponensis]|uniref:Acetyltransferase n=1 Tax=Bacillus manliponensis TaxID=574376 RepID=A0A073JRY2_9BACI|nr:GNAT family protein [Bacillus manliponensis]KEK17849.1 acetyltransferase [Bacillus manliponensis]